MKLKILFLLIILLTLLPSVHALPLMSAEVIPAGISMPANEYGYKCGGGSYSDINLYYQNDTYNFSLIVGKDAKGHYERHAFPNGRFWFCAQSTSWGDPAWVEGRMTIGFNIDRNGSYNLYLIELGNKFNYTYKTYMDSVEGESIGNLSYKGTNIGYMPLNTEPLNLTEGSHTILAVFPQPNNYRTPETSVAEKPWISYYILKVYTKENATPPRLTTTHSTSIPYHISNPFNIEAEDDIEIMEVNISSEGATHTLTKTSGKNWKAQYSKAINNHQVKEHMVEVKVKNTYGYTTTKTYNFTVIDAPDVTILGVTMPDSAQAGFDIPITVELFNNGTLNATKYLLNVIGVGERYINLTPNERENYTFIYNTQTKGGEQIKFTVRVDNSTLEYDGNNFLTSTEFVEVLYVKLGVIYDFSNAILRVEIEDENESVVMSNDTSEMVNNYIQITSDCGNISKVKFHYNLSYIIGEGYEISSARVTRLNNETGLWDELTNESDGVVAFGVNETGEYIWITLDKFSSFGIIWEEKTPPPPAPITYSGGGSSYTPPEPLIKNTYTIFKYNCISVIPDNYYAYSDVEVARNISEAFHCQLKNESELTDYDRKQKHLFLIGGHDVNAHTQEVVGEIEYSGLTLLESPYPNYTTKYIVVVAGLDRYGTIEAGEELVSNYESYDSEEVILE